ncbi:hypothetical protein [Microcoleus sp.]|uniref:hypothetical protein n=1 Tax=Microcoleus sp. TaxID=44472 RepID=UPI00403E7E3A
MIWAIFTQRLSADNLPPKGSSNSDGGLGAPRGFLVHDRRWLCTGFDLFYLFILHFTLDRAIE